MSDNGIQGEKGGNQMMNPQQGKYLTFSLAKCGYGIAIRHVRQVLSIRKITAVPDMPDFVQGVINLGGEVLPVVDVRTRFHLPFREYDDRTCIVVVDADDRTAGLVVDRVNEVIEIPGHLIEPATAADSISPFIGGVAQVDEDVRALIEVNSLLSDMSSPLH